MGSSPAVTSGSRGQLILIGGLMMAICLIGLTVIINAGLFTHNMAVQSTDATTGGPAVVVSVDQMATALLADARAEHPDDIANQSSLVTAGVVAGSDDLGRARARGQAYGNLSVTGHTTGTHIVQPAGANFTNAAGAADWEPVADTGGLSSFAMEVDRSALLDAADVADVMDAAFRVRLRDSHGNEWLVAVYAADGQTEVQTQNVGTGTTYGPCRDGSGSGTTINLTAGTVAGERCPALEVFTRLPNRLHPTDGITVQFNDTMRAGVATVSGRYDLRVPAAESTVDDGDFEADLGGAGPQARSVVYGVTVAIVYETDRLVYETERTITPGVPRG